MNRLIALLMTLLCAGCMSPDGTPDGMRTAYIEWYMNWKAKEFMAGRPDNERVLHLECRVKPKDGSWSQWESMSGFEKLVSDVVRCLRPSIYERSYMECTARARDVQVAIDGELDFIRRRFAEDGHPDTEAECRPVFDPGYSPDEVPQDMTDPDAVNSDDIARAILREPPMLHGNKKRPAFPAKCPQGGDGCPNRPDESFGNGSSDGDSTGGDP
jgi:hypothetical protein